VTGRLFYPGTPVSTVNQTYHHDIAEILLKVALNTKTLIHIQQKKVIIFLLVCAAILTLIIKPHNKVIYPMIDITRKVFNVIGGQTESSTLDRGLRFVKID
jgi:hypothetical protein